MADYDLSILIPSRNEMFLARTVQDLLENIQGKTEIIVVLDGEWADPPLPVNERLTVIFNPTSIGQRAATNQACKLSRAKYVAKTDAHCAFDKGFDVKMLEAISGHDDWTMAPLMKNLHAFNWVCPKGHDRYQGPSGPCQKVEDNRVCGLPTTRDVVWIAKKSPNSTSYLFDHTLHFQYFGDYAKRPEAQVSSSQSLSLQGSFFMLTRERYWKLNICDEEFGSWGQQGTEVACKTWLSGGEVRINKNTWYAHMFRTQGGDFSFPYPQSGRQIEGARKYSRDLFLNNKWEKQIHPLSWLIEKFWPVPYWQENKEVWEDVKAKGEEFMKKGVNTQPVETKVNNNEVVSPVPAVSPPANSTKGIIFYTDNQLDLKIAEKVQNQLRKVADSRGLKIISSSLKKMDFGDKNIHFPSYKRGYLAYYTQIVAALENSTADFIFMCEHDVLYHPSHFDFTPPTKDKFYYNNNVWKVRNEDGHALRVDDCDQVSGLCASRELLLEEYKVRLERIKANENDRHFEPGTHDGRAEKWWSEFPNVDIRHNTNLTASRWTKEEFRNQKYTEGWTEAEEVPGWGRWGIDF